MARSRRASGPSPDDRRRAARRTSSSVSAFGQALRHPRRLDAGARGRAPAMPSSARKRCSERTATERPRDRGRRLARGPQDAARTRSTSASADARRSGGAALGEPGDVGAEVAAVGRERVGRAAPLDRQPGEELLDLEREDGEPTRTVTRSRGARSARQQADDRLRVDAARPAAIEARRPSSRATCSTVMCCSSIALRCVGDRRAGRGRGNDEERSSLKPGELWNSHEQLERPGVGADLLGQLALRGRPRAPRRRRRACRPGSRAASRRARHGTGARSDHGAVVEHRHDGDRAGMVDDVALERRRRRAPRRSPTATEMTWPAIDRRARRRGGSPSRQHALDGGLTARRSTNRCGLRPSARASAAPIELAEQRVRAGRAGS